MREDNEEMMHEYLKESVSIPEHEIEEQFRRLPADLAYWHAKHSDALKDHLMAKLRLDQTRAELSIVLREQLGLTGKVTESMVSAAIESHIQYGEARISMIEAEAERARLRGITDAVAAKKEMLISLGAHLRQEMEHNPTIRDRTSGHKET